MHEAKTVLTPPERVAALEVHVAHLLTAAGAQSLIEPPEGKDLSLRLAVLEVHVGYLIEKLSTQLKKTLQEESSLSIPERIVRLEAHVGFLLARNDCTQFPASKGTFSSLPILAFGSGFAFAVAGALLGLLLHLHS